LAEVEVQQQGATMIVTINRPEQLNCVNDRVAEGITEALQDAETDASVRSVILTGAGDRAFCTGMDLKFALAHGSHGVVIPGRGFAGIGGYDFPKPLIAAVNGYAVAGGFEIVLNCDLVVASEGARFGLPEAKRGLLATGGGLVRLGELVSRSVAMEIALTSEPIDASRALALGMINRVVPHDQLLAEALTMATKIAKSGPQAILNSKRLLRGAYARATETIWQLNSELAVITMDSSEAAEGMAAFVERREPRWVDLEEEESVS
jgi:enoyl-CoA hydratase/carnithine racemase